MNFFLPLHTYFGSWQTTRFGEYFLKTLGDALKLKFPAVSPSYSPTVRMPANSLTDAVCVLHFRLSIDSCNLLFHLHDLLTSLDFGASELVSSSCIASELNAPSTGYVVRRTVGFAG